MKGIVFDIKEFALHDGGGVRTTVFLKGCPLRCIWCHNPEGLSSKRELYVKHNRCRKCGLCRRVCDHEDCRGFDRCLHVCPENLISVAGVEWDSDALAQKLLSHEGVFRTMGGGVTLSGGEPLMQADFCAELLSKLKGRIHTAIETSGYAAAEDFRKVVDLCDFVIMDIKLADREEHKKYTGVYNDRILENAEYLKGCGKEHLFRTPLIPCITDTDENLEAIAKIVGDSRIELLPYNDLAPAKYASVGRTFSPLIDPTLKKEPNVSFFKNVHKKK